MSATDGAAAEAESLIVFRVARVLALLGGVCIVAIVALTVAEVVSRRVTGRSLGPVDEVSRYLFAAGVSLSLAWATLTRAHIRIDILYARAPRGLRVVLDLVALASLTALAAVLVARGWQVLAISWNSGSRSPSTLALPLVLPQGVWLAGLAMFLLALLICCAAAAQALIRRAPERILERLSPPNVDDVVTAETRDVR